MPAPAPRFAAPTRPPRAPRALSVSILLILTSVASAYAEPLFLPPYQTFDTGPDPRSVCVADFDADGRPDLAVATCGDGSEYDTVPSAISVLRGNGDGTFGARTDFPVGAAPVSVATADLNADGRADLAVANVGSNDVSVLIGNGDGTFRARTDFATGIAPICVAIADLDGDGRLDLVTANYNANSVSVLRGNGDGTFQPRVDFGAGIIPYSVAAADLNGDGRLDLAVVNRIGTVSVLLGTGGGAFAPQTQYGVGEDPRGIAIGDLNGDGRPDLAVANLNSYTISLLLGNGDGTFGRRSDLFPGGRPHALAIADLDRDGHPDLAAAIWGPSTISVMLGKADGTLGAPSAFGTRCENLSVVVADLNRDGRPDLAACGAGSSDDRTVSVLIGNGDGTFGARSLPTAASPWSVAVADVDVDGKPDLVTANNNGTFSVLPGMGDGRFGTRTDYVAGSPGFTSSVAVADLNGDGWPDLVLVNRASNVVSVLLGIGNGAFGAGTDFGTGASPIQAAIGDFNADGRPDLVVANSGASTVSVLLGNGDGTFRPRSDFTTGSNNSAVAVADLNGDGRPDLAVVKYLSNTVAILPGRVDGTFGPGMDFPTGQSPNQVAIADVDGDRRLDLVVTNAHSRSVSVLLNGRFRYRTDFYVGGEPVSPVVADFDADGRMDIAVPCYSTNVISVLPGNGNGTFGIRTDYGSANWPVSAAAADLDADGRPDLAVANNASNSVSILLNRHGVAPPPIAIGLELAPDAIDLNSPILWTTGFLGLSWPLAATDIDVPSIRLNGVVPVESGAPATIGDHDGDGVPDLRVEFDRVAFEQAAPEGDNVPIAVTGTLGGRPFAGNAVMRARRATVSLPEPGSHLTAGSVAQVRWAIPDGVAADSAALLLSSDGGANWASIARRLPNTGSCDWTVPSILTGQAKLAVVLVESTDETGDIVDGVLGVSAAFSIEAAVGVDGPRPQFVLAIRAAAPNPSPDGRLRAEFTLPASGPARLELLDVAGRALISQQVGSLGPGRHTLDLSSARTVAPGIYFLRLAQGGREVRARAAVLR